MRVFLSYAQADQKWADALRENLHKEWRKTGEELHVWNPRSQIVPGENWALRHGRALQNADALVVLLSPDAVKSDWIKGEIDFALSTPHFRHKVIAVLVRPTPNIPWILEKYPLIKAPRDQAGAARKVASALKKTRARKRK